MAEYGASLERERKYLQRTVAVLGLIPVGAGLAGVIIGPSLTGSVDISADSHYRYLSGLLFAIGLCFWSTIPAIEDRSGRFRLLTFIVFIGGLGRLSGLLLIGLPSLAMLGGLGMELIVTPALCLWQGRVASQCGQAREAWAEPPLARPAIVPEEAAPEATHNL
jgi:hypothetical protein